MQLLKNLQDKRKVILAGGITPDNVQQAMACQVAGLDLNSGLESAPGEKDRHKVTQSFNELRQY